MACADLDRMKDQIRSLQSEVACRTKSMSFLSCRSGKGACRAYRKRNLSVHRAGKGAFVNYEPEAVSRYDAMQYGGQAL